MFADPRLVTIHQKVTDQFGELSVLVPAQADEYFGRLAESIISQQLSTKVADVIEARVRTAIGGSWQPELVLQTDSELLRAAGLSYAKVSYVRNIAQAFNDGMIDSVVLGTLRDEEVIAQLVQVKGVGRWTAEMFLIFTLARPDIFSVGDYGLRKAMSLVYGIDIKAKPALFLEIANKWQPNRSLASRILWKSLELV